MRIFIETKVGQSYDKVFHGFDEDLFLALKPPLMPLKLLRFDGCKTGDKVHIELGMGFLKQRWDALIIEDSADESEYYFIDKGVQLPIFLKTWQHKHRILKVDNGACIIDDIQYETPFKLLDYLMYPIMYLQFYARKPVYKRYFKEE